LTFLHLTILVLSLGLEALDGNTLSLILKILILYSKKDLME